MTQLEALTTRLRRGSTRTRFGLVLRIRFLAPALLFCALLAGGWEWMAWAMDNPLVPHVGEVGGQIWAILQNGQAFTQVGITLLRVVLGLALAFPLALAVASVAARGKAARMFFEPALLLGLTVPGLVWALLCVVWFGVSLRTSSVAIALSVAPALTISFIHGIRAVEADLIEMAYVFRFSRSTRIRYVWLPAIIPFVMSGTRLGFSLAWKVIVLVEMFGMSDGVGYQLNSDFSDQNVAGVLAWTIVFGVVMAIIEYGLLQVLERRLLHWRREVSV